MRCSIRCFAAAVLFAAAVSPASAQYPEWKHSGSIFVLTTPDGADLPAGASVKDFPLLIRLHEDFFDFRQAAPNGADLRFATGDGAALPYQIEEWDAARGHASVWVRIPRIEGNASQELKAFWGKPDARSESSGKAVFNASNGYLSVWHLGDSVADEVGTLASQDVGTTIVRGMIGKARHLAGKQGIFCGEKIVHLPTGAAPHSTEAWIRAEKPNSTIVGWGNEGGGRCKVCLQFRSPPHLHVDSDFADVDAKSRLPMGEWIHVVHTYGAGEGRLYVNGRLDGSAKPNLNIKSPARMWIGGWYGNYNFVGDVDEVRISTVARSADWIRLQYENQKPMQTLVGPIVRPGKDFAVSADRISVDEGKVAPLLAKADGARKIYWIVKRGGKESVAAVDRLHFSFDAGRVVGDESAVVRCKAVYADETKTKDIAIVVKEAIPEPTFALKAPPRWDGRQTIEVDAVVENGAAMQAAGAAELSYRWSVAGLATIKEAAPGKLILKRAQNSGDLRVTLALGNGGTESSRTIAIAVQEPQSDPWVRRTPPKEEMPQDRQFYARDDADEGTLTCAGILAEAADAVFLNVYADGKAYRNEVQKLGPDRSYALAAKLKPGLIRYRAEFGMRSGARETILHVASDLLCGDAYLIDGQSNAEATDVGKEDPVFPNDWIRSFGSAMGSPDVVRHASWSPAVCRDRKGAKGQIGYWGMELARRLVENHQVPICIINGAVGGSRIDQHQRNPADPADVATIYGRLLWRVRQAKLTHGIRGILWHQGENDQGADGPTGGFGWETYRDNFIEMAAGWKEDYPNLRRIYVFQIWPRACAMGVDGSDNMLREVQRRLPADFSNLSVMSTLGIKPPGGCHFPAAGYAEFARLIGPLVERDFYGKKHAESITPPNLLRANLADGTDEIVLEFDQPVAWHEGLLGQFHFDGSAKATAGSVDGNVLRLKVSAPTEARRITYLDSRSWSQDRLLAGRNGIAALTFCNVPIVRK